MRVVIPKSSIVFKERIYKIWKQFTTTIIFYLNPIALCSKNEYTKSESNSQHNPTTVNVTNNCVQRTNIQNLKAIHNSTSYALDKDFIVFKERIYKIWKQFTTAWFVQNVSKELCSKNEYTKSESNSQQMLSVVVLVMYCVQRTNIQNLKAIHNWWFFTFICKRIVFKERIYKIWKQFTTRKKSVTGAEILCSKNEYTKSESNSQHLYLPEKGWLTKRVNHYDTTHRISKEVLSTGDRDSPKDRF